MEYERSEATVKLALPGGGYMHEVAEGNGPVAALDAALRNLRSIEFVGIAELLHESSCLLTLSAIDVPPPAASAARSS